MVDQLSRLRRSFSFLALASTGACAISAPVDQPLCKVIGAAKLSMPAPEVAICDRIREALAARSLLVESVTVRVQDRGRFAVALVLPGNRALPDLNFARSDAQIGVSAIRRLAEAVANHAAKGAGR